MRVLTGKVMLWKRRTKGRSCFTSTRTLRTVRNFFNWGCVLGRFAIYISTERGGGVYQCKEDFAYVYGLTVKDYKRLEPYIRIGADYLPASSLAEVRNRKRGYERSSRYASDNGENAPNVEHKAYTPKIRIGEHIEINSADTTELMKIPGIGSYYSRQIVRYRNQLGGFVSKEQLLEIEDFPEEAVKYISIDESNIRRLRINQLTLSQLKRHPYLNYYQARAISDYRRLRGNIRSISELKLMKEFSSHDIERISPYIEY